MFSLNKEVWRSSAVVKTHNSLGYRIYGYGNTKEDAERNLKYRIESEEKIVVLREEITILKFKKVKD